MCRLYAFRSTEETKVECTLVHAQNALMAQSRRDRSGLSHAHGWGIVAYVGDRRSIPVSPKRFGRSARRMQQWARTHQVVWYVHQNPTLPGRLWHLRLTPAEHERLTGRDPGRRREQFVLYRMTHFPRPSDPTARWLVPHPAPPMTLEQLERLGRFVPPAARP